MGGRRRRGLADLIGEVGAAPQEKEGGGRESSVQEAREEARESQPGSGRGVTVQPAAREPRRDEAATPSPRVPMYLALERKEARLRGDQVDSLASLARRVNRRKTARGGERITENTLIRVAVDWLLSQEAHVEGSTEEEIRRSLRVLRDAP
ncbi:MAG: hypothetical protein M3R38_05255 [Actinomycetota bacterium]|nr:hypothetical protein [Actinomycetota bacterium]